MKDRPYRHRERLFTDPALPPADFRFGLSMPTGLLTVTVWANRLFTPPDLFKVLDGLLVRFEGFEELDDVHYERNIHHKGPKVKPKSELLRKKMLTFAPLMVMSYSSLRGGE